MFYTGMHRISYLLDRYIHGQLTGEEQQELAKLLQDPAQESLIQGELERLLQAEGDASSAVKDSWQPVLQRVLSVDKGAGAVVRPMRARLMRWSAAAAILLLLCGGGWFWAVRHRAAAPVAEMKGRLKAPILPGSDRAILTLANGQQVVLNSAQNGTISQQGGMKVIKLDSGALAYAGNSGSGAPLYNTITTPRGGQYQVVLSDGTKVWLNAESSLRFPIAFTGKDRAVELTGEAYFEVKTNKDKPFLVRAGQSETRVLGTQFNVMAYADEGAVKTTLLEGAVSMEQGAHSAVLQPGEQGQFDEVKGGIVAHVVNTRAVVAWKDGYYYFDRTPVQSVMRQIARWYDVQVVYENGKPPTDEIVGRLPRSADVADVLHVMELIGLRFRIEGRKIIVLG